MKKTILWIAGLCALAGLITGAYFLYDSLKDNYSPDVLAPVNPTETTAPDAADDPTQEPVDYSAPDFTVYDADGNPVKLSDMEGKPVVVNFWASWCPPCKAEMPDFEAMYKKYGDRVVFMMVNMTDGMQETREQGLKHVQDHGYTFPVYFDLDMDAAYTYYVTTLPQTYFITADGDLYTYAHSMLDAATLEKVIGWILPS